MIKKLVLSTAVATFATASFAGDAGTLTTEELEQLVALHAVDLADKEQLMQIAASGTDSPDMQRLLARVATN